MCKVSVILLMGSNVFVGGIVYGGSATFYISFRWS